MVGQQHGRGTIAILGALAVAVVVTLFGVLKWDWIVGRTGVPAPAGTPAQVAVARPAPAARESAAPVSPAPAAAPMPAAAAPEKAESPTVPSFDIVRVEPNGDSVIAGRAAPGATIELLRDGQVYARTAADHSGLFAFTPPALPPGSHQVTLQAIAPNGLRQRSRDSVTIVIAATRDARPLVALTSPDKPTVVLSNPEPPVQTAQVPAQKQAAAKEPETAPAAAPVQKPAASPPVVQRSDVKIVSVEAEESGRLFVSGQAAPGATVRLYLNESFIAPGAVGGDGKVSFAIGRGVKPGEYRVRLDDVDPVSGSVRSRAEVAFNVPVQVASAQPSPGPAQETSPGPREPAAPADSSAPAEWTAQRQADPPGTAASGDAGTQIASARPAERELAPGTVVIPDINTTIVSKGDNLWRISQRIYGQGYRYTLIFGANQSQIRNPDLIYPGQVFVLPADAERQVKAP